MDFCLFFAGIERLVRHGCMLDEAIAVMFATELVCDAFHNGLISKDAANDVAEMISDITAASVNARLGAPVHA